ncbi:hypothetical protein HQ544_02270 [Candidatus Falkowbacteria bacterium]|nr:hypothetical protein [Candidatus Falkowbacteria bacterium]
MVKKLLILIFIVLGMAIWSPWITKDYAKSIVSKKFESRWEGVLDGCGFRCEGCGVKESRRTFFGHKVGIEYGCGMKIPGMPNTVDEIYVDLFGSVHGL